MAFQRPPPAGLAALDIWRIFGARFSRVEREGDLESRRCEKGENNRVRSSIMCGGDRGGRNSFLSGLNDLQEGRGIHLILEILRQSV